MFTGIHDDQQQATEQCRKIVFFFLACAQIAIFVTPVLLNSLSFFNYSNSSLNFFQKKFVGLSPKMPVNLFILVTYKIPFLFFFLFHFVGKSHLTFLFHKFDNCFKEYILFLHCSLCYGHMSCHASTLPPRKDVCEFHSTSFSFPFQFVPSLLLFPRWLSTCGIYMHCWKVS